MNNPATLNPFLNMLLQMLITYVKDNIDEIIAALLALLPGSGGDEVKNATAAFKATPNEANLEKLVKALTTAGADEGQIAATIINKATVAMPARSHK